MKSQDDERGTAVSVSQRESWARLWMLLLRSERKQQLQSKQLPDCDSQELDAPTETAAQEVTQEGSGVEDS